VQLTTRRMAVTSVACVMVLGASAPGVGAAQKRITGKLSERGYDLIGLAGNGNARSVRVKRGRFRLRAPAATVTLHLRRPDGRYGGPIVLRREKRGRRAIVGVKVGARLGRITIRRNHAKVSRRPRKKWVDSRWKARARRGAPIGNGRNFGRVRSPGRGSRRPGRDRDLDGVPNVLDIDDDGDLVLDHLERGRTFEPRASQVAGDPNEFEVGTGLTLELHETVHANPRNPDGTPVFSDAAIDTALPSLGTIGFEVIPGDSAELDCGQPQSRSDPTLGGLVYCSRGGTGRLLDPNATDESAFPRFPECCDSDGDGMGTLTATGTSPEGKGFMDLRHGATTTQIGSGDLVIARVVRNGAEIHFPATLQYVFATVPTLASFDDGVNGPMQISYPVAGFQPGPPGPGTRGNRYVVDARAGGDVVLTMTYWRPERRSIPPEAGTWTDMGGLNYAVGIADNPLDCPTRTLSTSDPNLVVGTYTNAGGATHPVLADRASDRPADPANTFTFTVNATDCFASHGRTIAPGEEFSLVITGLTPTGGDASFQSIHFQRR